VKPLLGSSRIEAEYLPKKKQEIIHTRALNPPSVVKENNRRKSPKGRVSICNKV
jgi:hypothetical protein